MDFIQEEVKTTDGNKEIGDLSVRMALISHQIGYPGCGGGGVFG
jgi:hypothetical protein